MSHAWPHENSTYDRRKKACTKDFDACSSIHATQEKSNVPLFFTYLSCKHLDLGWPIRIKPCCHSSSFNPLLAPYFDLAVEL